ncbi:hypothetical protein CsSME_00027212 [Camellia sinensis var. sinensis]
MFWLITLKQLRSFRVQYEITVLILSNPLMF